MVFVAREKVHMHDTDMAGMVYFAHYLRFMHDAWQELLESENLFLDQLFHGPDSSFTFVIVHAEADYTASLRVGDLLETQVWVQEIGSSSFTVAYEIHSKGKAAGRGKTVHVTLDPVTKKKISVPPDLERVLKKHLQINAAKMT